MKAIKLLFITLAVWAALHTRADILELKNGTILNGRYVGGSAGTVRFDTSAGTQVLDIK